MKKILILLSLSLFSLYAAELEWAETYKEAVAKASATTVRITQERLIVSPPTKDTHLHQSQLSHPATHR